MSAVLIDCETCLAPASACRDCVMTVLLDRPPAPVELDDSERAALGSLAEAGLVPPLRLVPAFVPGRPSGPAEDAGPEAGTEAAVPDSSDKRRDIA